MGLCSKHPDMSGMQPSVLARIWIFFPKKELFNFFRELFAKGRSYHKRRNCTMRRVYYMHRIYKTKYSCIINYVIMWSTCKWLIPPMPFEEKRIFVREKDVICKKKKKKKKYYYFFFIQKDVICTRKRRYNFWK